MLGIDLDNSLENILDPNSITSRTPLDQVYKGDINNIIGMLHLRNAARFLSVTKSPRRPMSRKLHEPYFIPESTPLHTQLLNFQKQKWRIGRRWYE